MIHDWMYDLYGNYHMNLTLHCFRPMLNSWQFGGGLGLQNVTLLHPKVSLFVIKFQVLFWVSFWCHLGAKLAPGMEPMERL